MKLFDLYAEIGLNANKFDSGVKKATAQGHSLAASIKGDLGDATSFVMNKVSATTIALGNLMADAAKHGISMGKKLGSVGMNYNAQMESYVTNFRTMLGGSSEAAEKLTSDLENMASSTPFAMTDLADATQVLLQFGQESSTVLDTLQTLGDISMGDANKLNSLTLAFAQASSSGKLMGQDLMQMVNAGFNPLQTIVEKTNVSMGDLKDFMSDGKATGDLKKAMREAQREVRTMGDEASEGAKMLAQMAEEGVISADLLGRIFEIETSPGGKFYGAMEAASKTYSGMISTLEDDSTALMGKVFKPMSDFMTEEILPSAINMISVMDKAYDIGGLQAAVSAGTDFIGEKLAEWGPMAFDAGVALIANIASGVTGDEVSKETVKTTLTELWGAGTTAMNGLSETASNFMRNMSEAVASDPQSEKSIGDTVSSVFDAGFTAMDDLVSVGGTLLSELYASISGDTAGAENIKAFLTGFGDDISSISSGISGIIGGMVDGYTALFGELGKRWEAFKSDYPDMFPDNIKLPDDATGGSTTGGRAASMMLGVAASVVAKTNPIVASMAAIASAIASPKVDYVQPPEAETYEELKAAEEHGNTHTVLKSQSELLNMLGTLSAGGQISESQFYDWSDVLIKRNDMHAYTDIATDIMKMYDQQSSANDAWVDDDLGNLEDVFGDVAKEAESISSAVELLKAAAESIPQAAADAAASALAGAKVLLDGVEVGELILPTISAGIYREIRAIYKD